MAFSIKVINLGATFSQAELDEIQLAATDWASLLSNNDFADLSGVSFNVTNGQGTPQTVTLGSDDVTIFVSKGVVTVGFPPVISPSIIAGTFPSTTITNQPNVDYDYLRARNFGIKYQPAVGSIIFTGNQTFTISPTVPAGPPAKEYDLYTVAKHEIAHILGFRNEPLNGGLPANAFNKRVSGGAFVGPNVGTVPLDQPTAASPSPNHFASGTNNANTTWVTQTRPPIPNPNNPIDALMVPAYNSGPGILDLAITKLDLAVLADLGYTFGTSNAYGFTDLNLFNPIATNPNITSGFTVAGTPGDDTINGNAGGEVILLQADQVTTPFMDWLVMTPCMAAMVTTAFLETIKMLYLGMEALEVPSVPIQSQEDKGTTPTM